MKKLISVLLSCLILITSIGVCFTTSALANANKGEDLTALMSDTTKWLVAGSGSTTLFSDVSGYKAPDAQKGAISINTDAQYDYDGDKSSIKLGTSLTGTSWSGHCFGINLENIKENTEYILSFKYMTPTPRHASGYSYAFQYAGIFAHTVEGAVINSAGNSKNNGYLYSIAYNTCTASIDGTATNRATSKARTIGGVEANTWYNVNLPFNSGELNEALQFVVSVAQNSAVFLDDFVLLEVSKPEKKTPDCEVPTLTGKTPYNHLYTETAETDYYQDVTADDFSAYCVTLEEEGFKQYTTNEIGTNKFAVYTKSNTTVNVAYDAPASKIMVSYQYTDVLPALKDENRTAGTVEPFMAQINNLNTSGVDGMSYAYRLDDGRFILIDGGTSHTNAAQADSIYNFLKENSETEDIKIAAWVLTHAHSDHIGGFSAFVEKYHDEVEIEQLIYNFPDQELLASNTHGEAVDGVSRDPDRLTTFYRNVAAYLPETEISTPHTGYKYHIGNAVIEILYTFSDFENSVADIYDFNVTSTAFRVYFEGYEDKATTFFGDALGNALKVIVNRYPVDETTGVSPIQSYFMQIAHHGYNTDSTNAQFTTPLYRLVDPTVALWPVAPARFRTVVNQAAGTYVMGAENVKEIVIADYGTRIFTTDYVALESENKFSLPNPTNAHELNLEAISTQVGFSIRKQGEKPQAVRFKFKVPSELIGAKCSDGYYLAEYGVMLTKQDNLTADATMLDYYDGTAKSLKVDGVGTKYKGIVYNGEKLYVDTKTPYEAYNNADEVGYFVNSTVAMTNVGYNGSTTDYTQYDTVYSFRTYFAFKNADGDIYVHYGETAQASVFDVMQAILSTDESDFSGDALIALQSDKQYVKDFLDGKIEGHNTDSAAADIRSQWKTDSNRTALYNPGTPQEDVEIDLGDLLDGK